MLDKRISPVYKNKLDFVDENLTSSDGYILDVGCGPGYYFHLYKNKTLNFKGIDIDESRLDHNYDVVCADVGKLPFKSSTFTTIVCIDVLEHVGDDKKAISEIKRVLKRGGKLIISVPNKSFPFTYDPINSFLSVFNAHFPIGLWSWGHKRLYSEKQIKKILTTFGFRIDKFEKRSHAFIALFINYIPYLSEYVLSPMLRLFGFKKSSRFRLDPDYEKNPVFKIFKFLNSIDEKYFSGTNAINLCIIASKQ